MMGIRKRVSKDRKRGENKRKASLRSPIVPTSNRFDFCTNDEEQIFEDPARILSDGEK